MNNLGRGVLAAGVLFVAGSYASAAPIIFANFNSDEGFFNQHPGFSSTSVGEATVAPLSTADRVTTDGPFEGAGHQNLTLRHDGGATNMRIRHLANSGTPVAGTTFTTSAGVDGWIGYYAKTSVNNTGWTISLALDDSTNVAAGMDMGTAKPLIADGQWHLYEWNLDDDNDWVAASGAGGDGTIQNGQHSLDSVYIFTNNTGTANQARDPIFIDFVAKTDSGSVATLIPEPTSMALLLIGGALLGRRRRA